MARLNPKKSFHLNLSKARLRYSFRANRALWDVGGAKHHDGLESRINDFRVHCTMLSAQREKGPANFSIFLFRFVNSGQE
jgi:hypothetical protein